MTARASKYSPSRAKRTRQMIGNTMHAHYVVIRTKRKTRARTAEEFYGFREVDVVEMFFYKHGFGSGVWYRLKDGRVIDAFGKPSRRDRAWYILARIDGKIINIR
jgi:hypothetical protein